MHRRLAGTVKWFDEGHGMGVISAEGQGWDYLVLRCATGNAGLSEGEQVSFEPVSEELANWAFNVVRQ
ncbi:cold shock domain-containing protein [Pseudomonas sp. NBRC 111124]|uniref:cold shock domain-containing protein n=1 Tax=Pseudomonas sp. NBRC 111124 TaxID=1661039 RepID=UPI00076204E6|nr:cold shock domain-containing protein [Pseudomonas sp. NBRC 111124]